MAKVIEGLLPIDPIGALNKIKENYLRYFETAFKFEERYSGDDLDSRKNAEMRKNNNLFHEYPYCELIPEYVSEEKSLDELISELPESQKALFPAKFADFISKGLMDYSPYKHQFESLLSAFIEGKNTVITSGTGSGKTESFMLPLLASLVKEMNSWPVQNNYDRTWYQAPNNDEQKYGQAYQRAGETIDRPASIRALIMYPMNALVEDQIARLRKAIDGDDVRLFFDKNYGNNRIFFGQYNSSTIGHKSLDGIVVASETEMKKCFSSLEAFSENYRKLRERKNSLERNKKRLSTESQNPNITTQRRQEIEEELHSINKELAKIKEAWYIAPRLSQDSFSGEMVTRWDMQDKAPDILITNFSMLSAMMMRSSEKKMFKDTRDWFQVSTDADSYLTEEKKLAEKKKRVFHLILDELHLYRGTAGTEVAYLIRSFLNEIGVPPVIKNGDGKYVPNEQLRIIASSASLDDPQDFLKQFFGIYDETDPNRALFNIIKGSDYTPRNTGQSLDYELFSTFAQPDNDGGINYIDDPSSRQTIREQFITSLNDHSITTLEDFVKKYQEKIFYDFKCICETYDEDNPSQPRYVPRSLHDFATTLFNNNDNAVRGFFIFRADPTIKDLKLPRFRFHQFFKYVEGLWGELTDSQQNGHQQVIGSVMYTPQEVVQTQRTQHRVLELLRCECCGELFIGGNRRTIDRDNYYLTLNYPELDKIPNRNPTPMVQNKRYPEYVVFWPHESSINIDTFTPIGSDGSYGINSLGFNGRWQRAYLNPVDGKMELSVPGNMNNYSGWIKGYAYVLSPTNNRGDESSIMALPCLCPHCDKDYHFRRYTKSPIRSFRSGISRSNQMICKELFYQLPTDNKKLIGFSDSRQDAAEQAADIAVEHYRDMVRLSFMECVSERQHDDLEQFIDVLVASINNGLPNNGIQYLINTAPCLNDIQRRYLLSYAQTRDIASIRSLHNDDRIIRLDDLVSSGNQLLGGRLVEKLLRMGINPAGPEYADQTIQGEHWSCLYDFNQFQATAGMDATNATRIRDRLTAAIFHNSFGEYFKLSAEDVGLGYLGLYYFNENNNDYTCLQEHLNAIGIDIKEFLNAYIRVLGDHFRYNDPDSKKINNHSQNPSENNDWDSFSRYSSSCKKHIETIAELLRANGQQITRDQLGDLVHNTLEACGIRMAELSLNSLGFYKVSPDNRYYECPVCHRVHLHWGMGLCSNAACRHPLDHNIGGTVNSIHERNFISYDLIREKRKGCRIHTEELSGQTDDQGTRLLEFKGIILDNPDQAICREIDMINVTTTMEVGVDIGGLLAVFQGNMPPTRYNYQQRVGRGGRRGQPFSTAITFCRGKSHDAYYYADAVDKMLGGIPSQPKLSIKPAIVDGNALFNDEIVRRVILKQILHMAMTDYFQDVDDIDPLDVVGELGLVSNWSEYIKPDLIEWINNNHQSIEKTVHYYFDQYNENGVLNDIIRRTLDWFYNTNAQPGNSSCINAIDAAINASNCRGIGQCLSEAGLLPLYGMPSNSRVLYHGFMNSDYRVIDRPVEQSITEFAPGSIKTKDHGYYSSAGLSTSFKMRSYVIDGDRDEDDRQVIIDDKRWDVFEFCHRMIKDSNTGRISDICPQTEDIDQVECDGAAIPIIIPKAYRTNQIYNNLGRKSDNNDKGNYSQASIWVDASQAGGSKLEYLPNATVQYWSCDGDNKPTVWYINDNNGKLFTGQRFFFTQGFKVKNGATRRVVSGDSPKHIAGTVDDIIDQINVFPSFLVEDPIISEYDRIERDKICHREEKDGQPVSHSIALGAKKVTEMICISVRTINNRLNLSIGGQAPGYEPAIIAAYYSAATLIQRTFADQLDIQPDEIDISEIKIENGYPVIYMSDALANGSGYVGMLMEKVDGTKTRLESIMEKIIHFDGTYLSSILNHRDTCTTSCPQCLRTYQNAGFHHVLDWRLGVDLIKLMLDDTYDMGYTRLDDTPYGDLENQLRIAGKTVTDNNPMIDLKTSPDGHYYLSTRRLIPPAAEIQEKVVHPLWNHNPTEDQNCFELLRTGYKKKENARSVPLSNTTPAADNNITFHL